MDEIRKKAALLSEALPYIQKYAGKIFVIKLGGNAMVDENAVRAMMADIALLHHVGIKPVLVHGGGPEIDLAMRKARLVPRFVNGLRYTDAATLRIVRRTLKNLNKDIRHRLHSHNCRTRDVSENLLQTRIRDQRLGLVGDVVRVNREKLLLALQDGVIPVVSPIGFDGRHFNNVNADTAAARIASALRCEKLTLLTNVEGVYLDNKWMSHLTIAQAQEGIRSGVITKGMIPKVQAGIHAVQAGVHKAHLIDGTAPHSLLLEFFTDKGVGTEIVKNGPAPAQAK